MLEGPELFTVEQRDTIDLWTIANAERWAVDGGPLAPRARGGADVIVVDGFQMPALVSFAKRVDPGRSIIFRSYDMIRTDLISRPGSSAMQIWEWIWSHIQFSDLLIFPPIRSFVPPMVPRERLAYMPLTIDWLDGANKDLADDAVTFYHDEFNDICRRERIPILAYPERDYILQITAFDSYTAIECGLAAYAAFLQHSRIHSTSKPAPSPQLVICGYSSIGDLYSERVLERVRSCLDEDYAEYADSVIIVSLDVCDQMFNALLSRARVVLQLSSGDVYEVAVSEALHKGVPVIARNSGGNALQIRHSKNGFLVQGLDKFSEVRAVAEHIDFLFGDEERYYNMALCGRTQFSDEVGTVGNAVCWLYLADRLTSIHKTIPNGRWVWDMAKEHSGERVPVDEVELPRNVTL
jgi:glycosyltransferase involved in cell wall biosynthesis